MVSHDSERVAAAVKAAGLELRDLDDGTVLAWRELDEGTAFYKLTPISMTGGFTLVPAGTVELCKGSPKIHGVEGLNKGKEDTRSCASGRRRTAKRWWCTRKDLYSRVRAKKKGVWNAFLLRHAHAFMLLRRRGERRGGGGEQFVGIKRRK